MRIEFHGGAGTVTGSHHVLEASGARVGVDAGLFQGPPEIEALNAGGFGHPVEGLGALVLTHAHIDHSGRVPLLVKSGFRGEIVATGATADLCGIMLRDAAHLMEEEAARRTRHGEPGRPPLFTEADVERAMGRFRSVDYGEESVVEGIRLRLLDAGHILGSAIVELEAEGRRVVFSGDLGRRDAPLLRDPSLIDEADALVLESTYGGREHADKADRSARLFDVVRRTVERGGNVVVPAFAVGRTQDLLYSLNRYMEAGELRGLKTFVDSPMAISASEIYRSHPECFDAETLEILSRGDDPLSFPGVRFARTREESKAINSVREPHIVISASGMCTGGRVLHHLSHNLGREESTILFVGYQAEGTLGRRLRDGARRVRVLGRTIDVRARVEALDSFSAHADHPEIMEWLEAFRRLPESVFLVHGERSGAQALAGAIEERFGERARIPRMGDSWVLGESARGAT
ncbi:MAG: MBL fold metallo-hydrolase RNA specificity domain-containing protein [Thermoplasmatota archaeon]